MADEKKAEDKRPWWALSRFQGVALMAVGIGMLFHPVTAPVAVQVITVGAGWAAGGATSAVARAIFKAKPPPGK